MSTTATGAGAPAGTRGNPLLWIVALVFLILILAWTALIWIASAHRPEAIVPPVEHQDRPADGPRLSPGEAPAKLTP